MTSIFLAAILSQITTIETRVEAGLKQLSLAEKLDCIGGMDEMYTRPIPKLGIPRLRMSDGPAGVRCWGPSTAYPAPITVAASFNESLAREFGEALGADCVARDTQILLAPGVNLARVPQNGRGFEYSGEDPYLAARCAVGVIQGVQSKGVAATVKHFVANEHENDRQKDSSNVDETTLRELNLVPFEAAVKEGKVKCLMSGYNLLNGIHASQHDWLNNKILKAEWGFKGIHMSDWWGTHDGIAAALGGLDLEMPFANYMTAKALIPAVESGQIPVSVIDDKVRRLLRLVYEMGWEKNGPRDPMGAKEQPASAATALKIAREGMVLLSNRSGFLPLKAGRRKLAVLGSIATSDASGGGGSAYTQPYAMTTALTAIKKEFGSDGNVTFIPTGEDPTASLPLGPLNAEYFPNKELSGSPSAVRSEAAINLFVNDSTPSSGIPKVNFSARWSGKFVAPSSGDFALVMDGDDGYRVFWDGKPVIDNWRDHGIERRKFNVRLQKGRSYEFKVEFYQGTGEAVARFGIVEPFRETAAMKQSINSMDAAIVCVGYQGQEGEGADRPFELPKDQVEVVDLLIANHKNVVLVVNSGGASDLSRWSGKAAAIIQAWYPGQSGNQALAEILSGRINPSGKLPVTFPVSLRDTYYADAYPPRNNQLEYKEGLYTGYRWFDRTKTKPLYAFGHGLSYSKFQVSAARVRGYDVEVDVQNVAGPSGTAVVQVYVAKDGYRQLKGFARIELGAGKAGVAKIKLDPRAYARWNATEKGWKIAAGTHELQIGFASDDITAKLKAVFQNESMVP